MIGVILLGLRVALTAALYGFLGWVLWLLWRDLKKQQQAWAFRQITPLSLNIRLGETSRLQHFSGSEVIIGRDPNCECVLDSKTVSTRHARLSYHQGHWWVEDMGSTNGTLLNREPVIVPTVLAPGDQLQCGEAELNVEKQ